MTKMGDTGDLALARRRNKSGAERIRDARSERITNRVRAALA
jgi:hypothetical protein